MFLQVRGDLGISTTTTTTTTTNDDDNDDDDDEQRRRIKAVDGRCIVTAGHRSGPLKNIIGAPRTAIIFTLSAPLAFYSLSAISGNLENEVWVLYSIEAQRLKTH